MNGFGAFDSQLIDGCTDHSGARRWITFPGLEGSQDGLSSCGDVYQLVGILRRVVNR